MDQHYSPRTGQHQSSWMDQCYCSVLQLSFIQKIKETTSSRPEGMTTHETRIERERPPAFWLLLLSVFSPLPGPALCKLGQPGVLFVLPEVLTLSSDLPLFCVHGHFPALSFSHHHFGLPFSYSNYLTVFSRKLSKIF